MPEPVLMPTCTALPCGLDEWLTRVAGWQLPTGHLSQSIRWIEAAHNVAGAGALRPVLFRDPDGRVLGAAVFEQARLGWRSGSPGRAVLRWPLQEYGAHFAPIFRRPGLDQADWLVALTQLYPDLQLELRRSAAILLPEDFPADLRATPGPGVWTTATPRGLAAWQRSLTGEHRRDLGYYRRRIDRAAGLWRDLDPDQDPGPALEECLALHARRVAHKGQRSAYLTPRGQRTLQALCRNFRAELRLSFLDLCGAPVAASLAFLHGGRYSCLLTGWDPRHRKLDLGRQVIHHQLLAAFRADLQHIDLGGGDLSYKQEFGLQRLPSLDFTRAPSRGAALREGLVRGALRVYRRIRQP